MTIAIVCNNRAERGPLQSVIAALPEARVFGLTERQQRGEPAAVMGFALYWFTQEFRENPPKLVIVLGDRYETLAAALAATFLRIPLAHIHGGETTTGAFDDAFRDAITRMSALHFVATEDAQARVCRLMNTWVGAAGSIYHVGAPGLDGIPGNSAKRDEKLILVTYHPETMAPDHGLQGCQAMLDALAYYATEGYRVIFCGVNNDPGGAMIRDTIDAFCIAHGCEQSGEIIHEDYVALMQKAQLVIGNSSAGVIEAPWVGVPSVNIGYRQNGRPMANGVFRAERPEEIEGMIRGALAWTGPYDPIYRGGAAPLIAKICREFVA